MSEIDIPKYDGRESINQYIRKVEKYKIEVLKEKYDEVLNFINEWTNGKYCALSEFKNIQETILLKDDKHNRKMVRKYSDIFKDKFDIDLSFDIDTDSDEINDKYIIYLLMKIVGLIDYTLTKKEFNKKTLYTIKKK